MFFCMRRGIMLLVKIPRGLKLFAERQGVICGVNLLQLLTFSNTCIVSLCFRQFATAIFPLYGLGN